MKTIVILLGLLAFASPASAAQEAAPTPTLSIAPGETVTVRIADNDGGFIELSRTRGEANGARAENTVRFSFSNMGGQMMLQTENGYARAFDYRARMFNGRRSANTSICTVLPGIMGLESWSDRIDRLELREPRLSENAAMRCQ
jgi:hypothetical protein